MERKKLNADIPGSIALFQSVMRSFELKRKLYRTIVRGRGLEFNGFREYTPQDDAKQIDWKASKRANQLLVREYIEEENLKIVLIIDVGDNMVFGSTEKLKCEYAAEVVAALSNLILTSRDRVGYMFFSDRVKEYVTPSRGDKHFWGFMNTLTDASLYGGVSNIEKALEFAMKYVDHSVSSIVIISDFIKLSQKAKDDLAIISKKYETMAIMIKDPLDKTLPDIPGEVIIEDTASKQRILINPQIAKKSYERYTLEQEKEVKKTFRERGIDLIELTTDKPFVADLAIFLKERSKMYQTVVI